VLTFFRQEREWVLQMWTFKLFGAKNIGFSKFMVYPHGQGD